jgi:hypothetical protein
VQRALGLPERAHRTEVVLAAASISSHGGIVRAVIRHRVIERGEDDRTTGYEALEERPMRGDDAQAPQRGVC